MAGEIPNEELEQLRQRINEINATLGSMSAAVILSTKMMTEGAKAGGSFDKAMEASTKEFGDYIKAQGEAEQATLSRAKADQKVAEVHANLKKALDQSITGLKQFTSGMLTAGGGMSKYGSAVSSAGDAAWNIGKNFGILGKIIGGFVKGLSVAVDMVFKQNDSMLKAADSLAQMGVNGGITSKEILSLGQRAGYASGELEQWVDVVKGLGTDIISLGASATEGVKAFGELTKMDEKMLEGYRNLGLSQQQVNKTQADFIKLQLASGREIKANEIASGQLRKSSTAYIDNLLELSALSGMDIEDIKKRQAIERASLDVKIKVNQLQAQEEALRAKGVKDEDNAALKERKAIEGIQDMGITMKMTSEQMAGLNSMLATGNYNELSKAFATGAPGVLEFISAVKKGTKEATEFPKFMADATDKSVKTFGDATRQVKGLGNEVLISSELIDNANKYRKVSGEEAKALAKKERAAREAAMRGELDDDAKRARNAQETAERRARLGADAIVGVLNGPVTNAFEKLMKVMGALAKGIAHFAKWLGGPDFTKMFESPEDIAEERNQKLAQLQKTDKALEKANAMISDPAKYKKEVEERRTSATKEVQEKAKMLADLKDQANKEQDINKKKELQAKVELAQQDLLLANEKQRDAEQDAREVREKGADRVKKDAQAHLLILEKRRAELLAEANRLEKEKIDKEVEMGRKTTEEGTEAKKDVAGGPATKFEGTSKEFYNKMYTTLLEQAKKQGVENPEAIARLGAAQSSLETGYGKSTAGGNNFFGIKAKPGDKNASMVDTQEWDAKQGKMVTVKAGFRKYNNMDESAADYIKFLQENKRYKDVLAAKSTQEAIAAQGKTGYATDPMYAQKLATINARGMISGEANQTAATAARTGVDLNGKKQDVPEDKKAALGGLFDGPKDGYFIQLHGKELVLPIQNDNSTSTKTALADLMNQTSSTANTVPTTTSSSPDSSALVAIMDALTSKLDDVIEALENGNDTRQEILQYSRV